MKSAICDLCVFAGVGLITYGSWLYSPALGCLVLGCALVVFGVLGEWPQKPTKKDSDK